MPSNLSDFPSEFKGDLVTPEHPEYTKAIARWAMDAKRYAKIVAFVEDVQDMSLAIQYARSHDMEIAIKGGGHNPAGASSTEGLVIDLHRYFDYARVDPEKKIAYVGGGAIWETVDKAAIEYGLATVGGIDRCRWPDPGRRATVVLADGTVVNASKTENPDLFWGIRGGGSNFGVVSEFVFQLYDQRRTVFSGMAVYDRSQLEALTKVTAEWWDNPGDKSSQIQTAAVGPDGKPVMVVAFFYNGSEAEGRMFYKKFFDIGPIDDQVKEIPYELVNALQNHVSYHGQGVYQKGVAHRKPEYETVLKVFDRVAELTAAPAAGPNPAILFEYFPLHKITAKDSEETPFRRDPVPSILVNAIWVDDTQENRGGASRVRQLR